MADKGRIRDFIVKTIEKKSKLPTDQNIEQFNYIDSGHIDSIGLIKFILDLENEFGIDIAPEDMDSEEFRTIGGLAMLIERRLRK
jgi:acyl carrier protein